MTLNSYTEFNQIYSFIPLRKDGSDAAMFWFTGYSDGVRSVELLMIAGPQWNKATSLSALPPPSSGAEDFLMKAVRPEEEGEKGERKE